MSTISASTTSTTAFKVTADTTGTLVFQTGASPTTAMSISSSQIISFTNPPTATGAGSVASNTAFGTSALAANTTGDRNFAAGGSALAANTTGAQNSAAGYFALTTQTTGNYNAAFGAYALNSNTTASNNAAFGYTSLYSNTTGASNTSIGFGALFSNTTASNNTAVGYQAGYSQTTGSGTNSYFGYQAGYGVTTGAVNTFIGYNAGASVTTGSKNTIIGAYGGNQGGLDIRTASNQIVLSDGDGNPRCYFDGNVGGRPWFTFSGTSRAVFNNTTSGAAVGLYVWYNAATPNNTASEFLYCDDASATRATIRSNGGIANYSGNNVNLSDRREKTNFAPAKSYLDVICAIPVQTFNYIDQNLEEDDGLTLGVVAQDVQAVAPELVMESNWAKAGDEPKMRLSIYQTDLQYALMKALQELKAEFDAYKEAHP